MDTFFENETREIIISPDSEYKIKNVFLNNLNLGPVNNFSISHINADHNISVQYERFDKNVSITSSQKAKLFFQNKTLIIEVNRASKFNLNLFNASGELIYQQAVNIKSGKLSIPLNFLNEKVKYYLQINNNDRTDLKVLSPPH